MAVPIPASAYESSTFAPGTMQAGAAAIQARAIQSVTDACTAYQNAAVNAQSAWVAYRMAPLGEPTRQALNAYNGAKDDADLRYQQYLSTKAAVEASYGPLASSCSPPLPSAVPATSNIPTGPMPVPPGITPPSGGLGFRVPPPFGVPTSGPAPAPPVTVPTPVTAPPPAQIPGQAAPAGAGLPVGMPAPSPQTRQATIAGRTAGVIAGVAIAAAVLGGLWLYEQTKGPRRAR